MPRWYPCPTLPGTPSPPHFTTLTATSRGLHVPLPPAARLERYRHLGSEDDETNDEESSTEIPQFSSCSHRFSKVGPRPRCGQRSGNMFGSGHFFYCGEYSIKYTVLAILECAGHWHLARPQHCAVIISVQFQNIPITPKGDPIPVSGHSLHPLLPPNRHQSAVRPCGFASPAHFT